MKKIFIFSLFIFFFLFSSFLAKNAKAAGTPCELGGYTCLDTCAPARESMVLSCSGTAVCCGPLPSTPCEAAGYTCAHTCIPGESTISLSCGVGSTNTCCGQLAGTSPCELGGYTCLDTCAPARKSMVLSCGSGSTKVCCGPLPSTSQCEQTGGTCAHTCLTSESIADLSCGAGSTNICCVLPTTVPISCVFGAFCNPAQPPPPPCGLGALVNGNCLRFPTALGITVNTDGVGFIKSLFGIILSLSGGIALLLIILSGYKILSSQGNPEALKGAREQLTAAIVGLLFVIFSIVILQIIGFNILRIPGFG